MATNYIIGRPYPVSAWTEASEVAGMESSWLGEPYPTDVWRTASLTSQYVIADLGSAKAVTLIALMFTNLTSAATWRIRAAATSGGTVSAPDYDSGTVTFWAGATQNVDRPHGMIYLSAAQTRRYWRIDITDAANADGYFEAGRLILANPFKGARNYAYGAGEGFHDLSTRADSFGGGMLYETKAKRPVLSFEANWLSAAEMRASVLEIQRQNDGPVFAILNPDADTYRMGRMRYGLLDLQPVIAASFNVYATRFTLEDLI